MKIIKKITSTLICLSLGMGMCVPTKAAEIAKMRRPVLPESPMWIVHIDTWYNSDPEKIIDLIPDDILPYVVFNISMNPSWSEDEQRFDAVENGYETAKSWLRACAERGVWAMVQPAAGGPSFFEDYDPAVTDYEDTVYGEFFREYPNFIGFNYCEQFWGFDNYLKGISVTAEQRYRHFAGLLELCHKYGGYLIDSWCGNQWAQSISPLAMIKRVPEFEEAARLYSDNFILLEKFTSTEYFHDTESLVFGTYLSGYCGNFGLRYDSSGWCDENGESQGHSTPGYSLVTGLSVHLERMLLNGATVIDGPELTFVDDFYETDGRTDRKGYLSREWESTPQFKNVFADLFRKLTDGSLRIPTREEVIKRTKIIIVNDVESGSDNDKYSIPETLTEGLYKADLDGEYQDNHDFYKTTGRYPTVPITAGFADEKYKNQFEKIIYKSQYGSTWQTVEDKVADFDGMFSEDYSGDLYAGRFGNTWVVYNPYKHDQTAVSTLDLKYNTADSLTLESPRYSAGTVTEFDDRVDIYLNNFVPDAEPESDVIRITGASECPNYTLNDRGDGTVKPEVTEDWDGGVYTLTVSHNGPVEISVNCHGKNEGRSTDYKEAVTVKPDVPPVYSGQLQHEGEFFDMLNAERVVKDGINENVRGYLGQGYLIMGLKSGAKARETVSVLESGTYRLGLRYRAGGGSICAYVNGKKVKIELADTDGNWATVEIEIYLKCGQNSIEFGMPDDLPTKLYIDCFTLDLIEVKATSPLLWRTLITIIVMIAAGLTVGVIAARVKKRKAGEK